MNELEFTRKQFEQSLKEAQQDLREFGNIGVGVCMLDGLAVDYLLSKPKPVDASDLYDEEFLATQEAPNTPEGAVIESMRLTEFIDKMKYTLSILDEIWDLPAPEHHKKN